jgi:phosphatidylglycerophosphate synthase
LLTKLKKRIQEMLCAEANIAHRLGLTPNKISIVGFVLSLVSAVAYAIAPIHSVLFLILAVVFMLVSGFCDTMDGIVARTFNQTSAFGAFFDSVLDRYADVAIYGGIIIGGLCSPVAGDGVLYNPIWGLAALAGSVLVSYTRARAEGIGVKMESVGFAERAERMLILGVFTIIAVFYLPALYVGLIVLAVLTNFTVIQRVHHVFKMLKK